MVFSGVGCGRCGYYSDCLCLCYTTRPPTNLFSAFPTANETPDDKPVYANELDGLQAGVDYLEKLDNATDARFLQRGMHDELDDGLCDIPIPELPTVHRRTPSLRETPDRHGANIHLCQITLPEPEWHVPERRGVVTASTHEEYITLKRQYENELIKPTTIPLKEYQSEDAACDYESEFNAFSFPEFKKKLHRSLPQQPQWKTLRELHMSSKSHYAKFLRLTAHHDTGGIKQLRRSYGSAKGMLDDGITTFRNVLDGREPRSLKDVFAFTCLSYVMSKLLQKHGRMEGLQVLDDIDRWRLAIKRERDRHVYDEVVRIVWPEIDFLKQHAAAREPATPFSSESNFILNMKSSETVDSLFATSSMLDFEANVFSGVNRLEFDENSNFMNDSLDLDCPPMDNGLQEHLFGLLHETSTHENFQFGDFLNFELADSVGDIIETKPPDSPALPIPSEIATMSTRPEELRNTSRPITDEENNPPAWVPQTLSFESPIAPLLELLVGTIMFQVAVSFIQFMASLGELLFHLSGCGITTRRRDFGAVDITPPIQVLGKFINEVTSLILDPIKKDLDKDEESTVAVLSMADTFVRLGRLQTVREVEVYVVTTAHHLVCNFDSFVKLVSSTLNHCLVASDFVTWDWTYPSYFNEPEEYSNSYVREKEASEIVWALQNLVKDGDGDKAPVSASASADAVDFMLQINGRDSSSTSEPSPPKRQKHSPVSPNSRTETRSSTPASTPGDNRPVFPLAHCPHTNCDKSYTGRDARVNLRRHIRTVHEGRKVIKCPRCQHQSPRRDNVRKHFLLKHKMEELPTLLVCKTRA